MSLRNINKKETTSCLERKAKKHFLMIKNKQGLIYRIKLGSLFKINHIDYLRRSWKKRKEIIQRNVMHAINSFDEENETIQISISSQIYAIMFLNKRQRIQSKLNIANSNNHGFDSLKSALVMIFRQKQVLVNRTSILQCIYFNMKVLHWCVFTICNI